MTKTQLTTSYHRYIDCLNYQNWQQLGAFVSDGVAYNGSPVGLGGYRAMLERDFREIPDLVFCVQVLVVDPPWVSSRLNFTVTPIGEFFGLPINGRKVSFAENVFYQFIEGKIAQVWSVIDKAAIEQQLSATGLPASP